MSVRSHSLTTSLLMLVALVGCSDTSLPAGPAGPIGGNAGSAVGGNGAVGGNATSGGVTAGTTSLTAGTTSGGQGGSGGSAGSAGAGGGGGSAGVVYSDDPGTRAYEMHCLMCHGEQGVGTVLAPETRHPVREYSTWVVRNGLPGVGYLKPMMPIPATMLSDADLNLIYDYLDKPPQPSTAQGLYLDYCGNCHGADGKGGPTTRDITREVSHPLLEVSRAGTHPGMFDQRDEYMPGYPATRINEAELQMIADYVNTL